MLTEDDARDVRRMLNVRSVGGTPVVPVGVRLREVGCFETGVGEIDWAVDDGDADGGVAQSHCPKGGDSVNQRDIGHERLRRSQPPPTQLVGFKPRSYRGDRKGEVALAGPPLAPSLSYSPALLPLVG